MMRMSSSKLNVRSDGIEKAFDLANAAKQKMTSMHHTLFDFLRMKEDSAGVRVPTTSHLPPPTCHLHARGVASCGRNLVTTTSSPALLAQDTIRMFKQKVRELLAQLDSLQEDIRLKDRQSERWEATTAPCPCPGASATPSHC